MDTLDSCRTERREIMDRLKKVQDALDKMIERGECQIESTCGLIHKYQRELDTIERKIRALEPGCGETSNEQDRKAIAIVGGGRGVDIRAKNDDNTKYAAKKRKSYEDIIAGRPTNVKSNGHTQQQQQPVKI